VSQLEIAPSFPPEVLAELPTPCLIVDLAAAERNIERAAAYFSASPVNLRPHFKAHKCTALMRRQIAAGGCSGVTCATAWEAEVLAEAGFVDILVANQVVDQSGLRSLARAAPAGLTVCVDDPAHVAILEETACEADVQFAVLIEVDVGMVRCGLSAGSDTLISLARLIETSSHLQFDGIQGYEGHAVLKDTREERTTLVAKGAAMLRHERERLEDAGIDCRIVSGGGTGTFDISTDAGALDEIQAGSYVLMDARYGGLDLPFENALYCCTTVISRQRDGAVVNSGLKALSAEYGMSRSVDPSIEVVKLSDEHAQLRLSEDHPLHVGDNVLLVPAHIDPTVNLYGSLIVFSEEGLVDEWSVDGRRQWPAGVGGAAR